MRPTDRRAAVRCAAVVVALALGLGACGADYEGLTKAEFLKQANRTCSNPSKAGEEARNLISVTTDPSRKAKLYLEKVLPLLERELDRIAELKPPEEDREQMKEIIELTREDGEAFAEKLKADPEAAFSPAVTPFEESSAAATKYGIRICAA